MRAVQGTESGEFELFVVLVGVGVGGRGQVWVARGRMDIRHDNNN